MPSVPRFDFLLPTPPSGILGLILKTSEDCCNADHKNRLLLSSVILLGKGVIVSLDKKKQRVNHQRRRAALAGMRGSASSLSRPIYSHSKSYPSAP